MKPSALHFKWLIIISSFGIPHNGINHRPLIRL